MTAIVGRMSLAAALWRIVFSYDNGAPNAKMPPLGWSSWIALGPGVGTGKGRNPVFDFCDQASVRASIDAFHEVGLYGAGYRHFHLDDCWADVERNGTGFLQANRSAFPQGMKPLIDYAHSRGLTYGLYTCAGHQTCEGSRPGSEGHWDKDAATFAEWGVDVVKMDWCHNDGQDPKKAYKSMSDALNKTGRPMSLNLCEWGVQAPWEWAVDVGQSWRISDDHMRKWSGQHSTKQAIASRSKLSPRESGGPYGWNDMDMLQSGNYGQAAYDPALGSSGMTPIEYKTEFSMWAIFASPLVVTTPIVNCSSTDQIAGKFTPGPCKPSITPLQQEILLNTEVIAINQDVTPGGSLIRKASGSEAAVYARNLSDGSVAVAFYNEGDSVANASVVYSDIGLGAAAAASVRDLWKHKDLGVSVGRFPVNGAVSVDAHGTVLLRLTLRKEQQVIIAV